MSIMTEVFLSVPLIDANCETPEAEEQFDKVCEVLHMIFGEDAELDWRDNSEVWVLHSDDRKVFLDGTWRITEL